MEENSFNFTTYFTEEEANFLKDWHDEDMKYVKQWMRENNCPIYIDYSMAALRGGLPIIYVAKPEDLYTEEELLNLKREEQHKLWTDFIANHAITERGLAIRAELQQAAQRVRAKMANEKRDSN